MTNLNAIIVDEERLARVNLRRLLASFPEIIIIGEAGSCENALELIKNNQPHLVFLDIQLQGETCFELLELMDKSVKIIFVSAHDEDATYTFNVGAVDYLTKPVNPDRLRDAIERVKHMKQHQMIHEELCVF